MWAADSNTIFYVTKDAALRPEKVSRLLLPLLICMIHQYHAEFKDPCEVTRYKTGFYVCILRHPEKSPLPAPALPPRTGAWPLSIGHMRILQRCLRVEAGRFCDKFISINRGKGCACFRSGGTRLAQIQQMMSWCTTRQMIASMLASTSHVMRSTSTSSPVSTFPSSVTSNTTAHQSLVFITPGDGISERHVLLALHMSDDLQHQLGFALPLAQLALVCQIISHCTLQVRL